MRHKYKGRKLGSDYSHTKAMKVSLAQALFLNDRIKTTETRAKEIRRDVDKIIGWAKKGDLHSRRLAIAALGNDSELVREIFEKVKQGLFENRPGGYTRILKLGPRKGDGAQMVIIELVNETCVPKAERKAATSKSTSSKTKATPSKKKKKADSTEEKPSEEAKDADTSKETDSAAEEPEKEVEPEAEADAETEPETGKEAEADKEAQPEPEADKGADKSENKDAE